jgi:septal ring-binding cell division protein DamX
MGEFLVSKGVISREQQQEAIQLQKSSTKSFGAVLIEAGMLDKEELFTQARRQFLTILFSLFGLRDGFFRFEEGDIPENMYAYKVTFSNLITFGIRQMSDPKIIKEMVGDFTQIPAKTERFSSQDTVIFTEKEADVIEEIDGSRTIQEIFNASEGKLLQCLKTLLLLNYHGYITFKVDFKDAGIDQIIDLEKSAEVSFGFNPYEVDDQEQETAAAGSDFLGTPETGSIAVSDGSGDGAKEEEARPHHRSEEEDSPFDQQGVPAEEKLLSWGNLKDLKVPEVLTILNTLGKTGILYITRERVKKHIYLKDGVPLSARSNLKSELLGEFLVAKDVITREQQAHALQLMKNSGKSFGDILLEEGAISKKTLFTNTRRQFLTIVFSLFGLREGFYKFKEEELPKNLYTYNVTFPHMLVLGIRQISDPRVIKDMVGDVNQIAIPIEGSFGSQEIQFTEEEMGVVQMIDSARTIDDIARAAQADPLVTLKTLLIMKRLGKVDFQIEPGIEDKGGIVELEENAASALGFHPYQSEDTLEESAVAGTDFLAAPEDIGGKPVDEAPQGSERQEVAAADAGLVEEENPVDESRTEAAEIPAQEETEMDDSCEGEPEETEPDPDAAPAPDETLSWGTEADRYSDDSDDFSGTEPTTISVDLTPDEEPVLASNTTDGTSGEMGPAIAAETSSFEDGSAARQPDRYELDLNMPEGWAQASAREETVQELPQFSEESPSSFDPEESREGVVSAGEDDERGVYTDSAGQLEAPQERVASQEPVSSEWAEDENEFFQQELKEALEEKVREINSSLPATPLSQVEPEEDIELHPPVADQYADTARDALSETSEFMQPLEQEEEAAFTETANAERPSFKISRRRARGKRKRKIGFAYAATLLLVIGVGIVAVSPWGADLQEKLLARLSGTIDVPATEENGWAADSSRQAAALQTTEPAPSTRQEATDTGSTAGFSGSNRVPAAQEPETAAVSREEEVMVTAGAESTVENLKPSAVPPAPAITTEAPVLQPPVSDPQKPAKPAAEQRNAAKTPEKTSTALTKSGTIPQTQESEAPPEKAVAKESTGQPQSITSAVKETAAPQQSSAAVAEKPGPSEGFEAKMDIWTERLRDLPATKYTIQVEISGNLRNIRQDLSLLTPEFDAMVIPYQVKDWKAYTLVVGVFDSRQQGNETLPSLPERIKKQGPLVKTMRTIQKGLMPTK